MTRVFLLSDKHHLHSKGKCKTVSFDLWEIVDRVDRESIDDRETSLTIHLFRLTAFDNERQTIWLHIFHSICKKTQLIGAMLDESKIPKLPMIRTK